MKVKVNALKDPDSYRGGSATKFVVTNWQRIKPSDLNYLLKSILYPQLVHAKNGKIILK